MSASSEKKRRQADREAGINKKLEAQMEAESKAKKSQLKWRLGMVAIALFVVLSIVLNTSLPFAMTAAKIGDTKLSAAEMNYFYANAFYNYSSYFSMFGVDTNAPLENQDCPMMEDGSWKDFLLQEALTSASSLEAIYQAAMAEGYELSAEGQASVDESIAEIPQYAEMYGYPNVKSYLKALYGTGVTESLLREMITKGTIANEFATAKGESFTYTDDELMAYYNDNKADFVKYDYAYYYIAAETETVEEEVDHEHEEGDDHDHTVTRVVEGGLEAVKAEADAIAAKISDMASFEAAVAQYKEGATVQTTEGAAATSINTAFREWVAEADRKTGDVTTATSESGAYVVMYLGMEDNDYNGLTMRHILVKSVDADEDGSYSAEEMAEALKQIQAIEDEWNAGEKSPEAFAALAEKYSEDEGSNTNGGLYENIGKGTMVAEINDFLFADGRQVGDTAILHGNNGGYDGYHLVYFAGEGRDYRLTLAENAKVNADYSAWEEAAVADFTGEYTGGMGTNLIGK